MMKDQITDKAKQSKNFKNWYHNNAEIIVAVTCVFCDDIILGRKGRKICHECSMKWSHKTPVAVKEALMSSSSFAPLPYHLLAWSRIMYYRDHGIYKIKGNEYPSLTLAGN